MKRIFFFALKEDILPVLEDVERDGPLIKYVLTGNFLTADRERFSECFLRGADIPNLGEADQSTASVCASYLVTEQEVPVLMRPFTTSAGIERYCVDQLVNPDTVVLTPGGLWGEDIVLYGLVATLSNGEIAQGLMKRFKSALKKRFTKVGMYWVGDKALALLDAGKRLTIAEQSPPEYNLKR